MKRFLISAVALAGLGGCATYDYAGGSSPGGYYSGSPSYEYAYPEGYYGGYGGSYGYGLWGGYGGGYGYGYGYSPGYYGGYSRPIYVIRPRPSHGDHDDHHDHHHGHRPPPVAGGGPGDHRPPSGGPRPWRPGEGRPRPPAMSDEDGRPRPNLPGRPGLPRAEGSAPPSRQTPVRPPGQPQSQPRPQSRPASPAVPRESHFRNRPARSSR